jgi:uncharacterized protein YjiS (DUF1127 family)
MIDMLYQQGGAMAYEILPLPFNPHRLAGLSDRLLVSHYETTTEATTPFLPDAAQSGVPSRPVGRVPSGRQPLRPTRLWSRMVDAWRRHRSRQLIARLDAHMLKDIGVTFAEAEHEANKPFWVR